MAAMILWTIWPPELVMAPQEEVPVYEEISLQGVRLQVMRRGPHEAVVVRLLTTDPAAYLNTALQPGTVIAWRPALSGQ